MGLKHRHYIWVKRWQRATLHNYSQCYQISECWIMENCFICLWQAQWGWWGGGTCMKDHVVLQSWPPFFQTSWHSLTYQFTICVHQCAAHVPPHFQFLENACIFRHVLSQNFLFSRCTFSKFSCARLLVFQRKSAL